MEAKLQTLLDQLYEEGVSKGKEVAAALVHDAERRATEIVEKAEQDAADLREQARKDSEELRRNVTSELELAAEQSLTTLKQEIQQLIELRVLAEPLREAFRDKDFLRQLVVEVVGHWREQGNREALRLQLPAALKQDLEQFVQTQSQALLDQGVTIDFHARLTNGFRIGPAEGRYVLSFTDQDFTAFFIDHLRQRTRELLFRSS